MLTKCGFELFDYHYGDVGELDSMFSGWFFLVVMGAVVSMAVQWFFAWRVYILSQIRALAVCIAAVSTTYRLHCWLRTDQYCLFTTKSKLSLVQGVCGITCGFLVRRSASLGNSRYQCKHKR